MEVTLRRSSKNSLSSDSVEKVEKVTVKTQVLIDATGSKRAVINYGQPKATDNNQYYRGIGTEYLITVDETTHQRFADTLVFSSVTVGVPRVIPGFFPWIITS
ncbi:hypothetical protein NON20_14525 [Synechocystis sp. B12]|nr:hypothetical protein NON20_14525 [Synechocystis sp. B12]